MHLDKLFIVFTFTINYSAVVVESYKFLGILPTTFKSHFIFGSALMKGLAKKGHEVYVISPFPQNQPIENYHDVPFAYNETEMQNNKGNGQNAYDITISYQETMMAQAVFESPHVQQLMKSNLTFDAVICEVFYSEALFGFSEHYEAPLIGLSTFSYTPWNTVMIGSPSPPSYVPNPMMRYSDHMHLFERLNNLKWVIQEQLIWDYIILWRQSNLYAKFFPHLKRGMYTVRKNAAAVLVNTHVSLTYPRPYVPNHIAVGGLHINRQHNALPDDIENFIKNAKHGVVYFSMGTNMGSKNFLAEINLELLEALQTLKQRVLWKLEDPKLQGKHKNVLIRDWFPQGDILAHKNVIVFVTQGGLLSIIESIYHATPFVGIPVLVDQFSNMAKAERDGIGFSLNYGPINAEDIVAAVGYVIYDKRFTQRIKKISALYRDQPMLPLDLAVYWVERVARQKGSKHLHCAGLDLNFIQYHSIDVMLFLLLIVYAFMRLVKLLYRKLVPRKILKPLIEKKKN